MKQQEDCLHMDRRRSSQPSGDSVKPLPEPEPARLPRYESDSEGEREATELRSVGQQQPRLSRILTQDSQNESSIHRLKRFWRHHIRASVPHVDCRDHLGESLLVSYIWSAERPVH